MYDPAPAPGWVSLAASAVGPAELTAVGAAQATINPQRDLDLATRDAKARIARFFKSEVSARTLDWSLALSGGAADADRSLVQQSTEVRSGVSVEHAELEASYRDQATGTQYVRIRVDRVAWAGRLVERIAVGVKQLDAAVAAARAALEINRPLRALAALIEAAHYGRALGPDVQVSDLLDRRAGAARRLVGLKAEMDELGSDLRARTRFALRIEAPRPQLADRIRADLTQFLAGWGFGVIEVAEAGRDVRIDVSLTQQAMGTERIAGRTDFVQGASATLGVRDADGTGFPDLAVQVNPGRYQERDADQPAAITKALDLGADTLCAKFRSAFRTRFAGR